MMGSFITRAIIMALGYVYPAYECFKIVEKKRPDLEHLRFWCQYWMIIAVVTVVERLADVLVSWVPMYSEAKLAFIIYLWYPKTMGTTYVYHTFLRPFVTRHESDIDRNLNELRTRAGDVAFLWWQRGSVYAQARFFELLQYVASQSNRPQQSSIPPPVPASITNLAIPKRPPAQGPPKGPPQGGQQVYPPPPPPAGNAPGKSGHPQVNVEDAPYPPPGLSSRPGSGSYPPAQAGQEIYPPTREPSGPIQRRRGAGSRTILSDSDGDSDYDVIENHPEKRTDNKRSEQSVPPTGEQDLPARVYNTRIRQRSNGSWNLSVWFPTWLGTPSSKKVD